MIYRKTLLIRTVLTSCLLFWASVSQGEIVFEETFDDQPDWTGNTHPSSTNSRLPSRGDVIPEGWSFARIDTQWGPSTGHGDRHEAVEILAANSDKSRGGVGKSMVSWRDSYDPGWNKWNSDGVLLKRIGDQSQAYFEFYISFSKEMYESYATDKLGNAKIFRVYSWTGDWNDPFKYFDSTSHPALDWSIKGGPRYGIRNKLSLYGIGGEEGAPEIPGKPHSGDYSLSYMGRSLAGMAPDGGDAKLPDQINGGYITPSSTKAVSMEQVFGPPGTWNKVAFFVKLNSGKGKLDGVLTQWINDTQILHTDKVNWVPVGKPGVSWNVFGLGGNDYFQGYPNERRYEEWYAIDDVRVLTKIPDNLEQTTSEAAPPNPPGGVGVN
ncbi:hypothetical protein [uncultured Marinobacter sp.]|uniref:hypothetical protein n=1 Tax=uncultured Marinobacter sp. TaxID=187379 RepID=UPI002626DFAF|nr:hypothetical protein [uncultured Marinobacter sp.]